MEQIKKVLNVGKLNGQGDVILTLTIKKEEREKETVNHEIINEYVTLSICGEIKTMNNRGWYSCGQILNTIRNEGMRKLNIPKHELRLILNIWDEYHLNDLKPNCCHQESFNCNLSNFKELQQAETDKCPNGYRYGSKWLVREIPSDVIDTIIELFEQ